MKMRGLRRLPEVRSMAGAGGAVARPKERHVLQFKIGCLELERSRRLKEKEVALDRIRAIDQRVGAIEAEIRTHHQNLGYAGTPLADRDATAVEAGAPGSAQPRRMIRYGG